jgi:DNA-binding transcriptional regulator YiaG
MLSRVNSLSMEVYMPNFLPALNEHVRRLARREIRSDSARTKRASAQHRRDIATLKRQIKNLTSRFSLLEKRAFTPLATLASGQAPDALRFRKEGLKTHRAKLGLSAKDYGTLVGVSGLTIYHWEAGKSKPRKKQLPAIAAIRGLGKREALARLARK